MWSKNPVQFAELHGLRVEDTGHFQCTAEHVVARCDGGIEHKNIVAACSYCNITRHEADEPLAADLYRETVQRDTSWLTRRLLTP